MFSIKSHSPNNVTSDGSSKNDHNTLRLASLKTAIIIWKFLSVFLKACGHTVHGALYCSRCSIALITVICRCS